MASIATVVTMGYGSFGSVNLLPTLGFGQGEVAAAAYVAPQFTLTRLNVATLDIARQHIGTKTIARQNVGTLEVGR